MSNQENSNVRALMDLHEFGTRCYQKGYRKAGLEMLTGIGIVVLSMFCMKLIDDFATRKTEK